MASLNSLKNDRRISRRQSYTHSDSTYVDANGLCNPRKFQELTSESTFHQLYSHSTDKYPIMQFHHAQQSHDQTRSLRVDIFMTEYTMYSLFLSRRRQLTSCKVLPLEEAGDSSGLADMQLGLRGAVDVPLQADGAPLLAQLNELTAKHQN